ncbi:unnamed protein product, partial [marine sediment metagenome]
VTTHIFLFCLHYTCIYLFREENKKIIHKKALELFISTLKNGLDPSDLEIKNSGTL